jgi:aromatic ring-opening dioxygenase catalytic subunit (LigB family)
VAPVTTLKVVSHIDEPSVDLTPVHFFSHGSTRMLEAETESGDYWTRCGEEALAHNVKGVIMMVSFFYCDAHGQHH